MPYFLLNDFIHSMICIFRSLAVIIYGHLFIDKKGMERYICFVKIKVLLGEANISLYLVTHS